MSDDLLERAERLRAHILNMDSGSGDAALIGELIERVRDANTSIVAFAGPAAAKWAAFHGLPDGHLHPMHYDILQKAGARMDSLTRATTC